MYWVYVLQSSKDSRFYTGVTSDLRRRIRDLPHACAVDDYIDALVAAWTAVCISRGSAQRIPSRPEMDDKGLRMEMWFPAV